ncbi:hypothetical protein [Sphingomonas sp.]|uniref:hypothetical protein n=1 Tax=Sphingomonas sp. TaxID=28214 RepID=UPI0031E09A7C
MYVPLALPRAVEAAERLTASLAAGVSAKLILRLIAADTSSPHLRAISRVM